MRTSETKTIVLDGKKYVIQLLDTITGLGVAHEAITWIADDADKVIDFFSNLMQGEKNDPTGMLKVILSVIPKVLTTQRLFTLASTLLPGATIDGEACDDKGMHTKFRGSPRALYTAIFAAVCANYEDVLPFLGMSDGTTGESSQEVSETTSE